MKYSGIAGAVFLLAALGLFLYRLHRKEENLITRAEFVPVDKVDDNASAAAVRFINRKTAAAYLFKGPCSDGSCHVRIFKHVPYSDEPPITSLVIGCQMNFNHAVVVHKVYGSRLLFRAFKKVLIRTGDLGIEGMYMTELDTFNNAHFERCGLFAMGEPGFDEGSPEFIKLAGALRGMDRKSVVSLGLSGTHIVAWGAETAQVLKLWEKLKDITGTSQKGRA